MIVYQAKCVYWHILNLSLYTSIRISAIGNLLHSLSIIYLLVVKMKRALLYSTKVFGLTYYMIQVYSKFL